MRPDHRNFLGPAGTPQPKDVEGLYMAAENAFRAGQVSEVQRIGGKVLELDPRHVPTLHLLRLLANGQGDLELEMQILNRIFSIDPNHVESLNGLGDVLRRQGQAASGIEACRRAIALRANYANAHNTLGLCYFETGSLTAAVDSFRRTLGLQPTLLAAQVNLAVCLNKLGRKVEATEAYKQAARLAPQSPDIHEALGSLLNQQGRPREALECFKRALQLQPNSVKSHLLLAESLQQVGLSSQSSELIERALKLDPNSSLTYCLLGFARHELGEFVTAISAFERSIALQPIQGDAYLGLVTSKKVSESDRPLLDQMIALLNRPDITEASRIQLHTALGKAFDDLREFEAAISNVDEGNRIALALEGDSITEGSVEAATASVDKTIRTFTRSFIEGQKDFGVDNESPIFIIGLPRSGTTLLDQILTSHSKVAAAGELSYWYEVASATQDRFFGLVAKPNLRQSAAKEYIRLTTAIDPTARFITDKYNDNFFNVGFLHMVFPNARFIHCRRNPLDNCLSIYLTPFKNKSRIVRKREDILEYYLQYARLMAHWRTVLPADRFLEVDYEDVVSKHEETTRRLISFCDLEWEDACLKHENNRRIVNTPSKWQARQPIYKTSVERWRAYEPWLGALAKLKST